MGMGMGGTLGGALRCLARVRVSLSALLAALRVGWSAVQRGIGRSRILVGRQRDARTVAGGGQETKCLGAKLEAPS